MTTPTRDDASRELIQIDSPSYRIVVNGAYGDPFTGTAAWYGTPTGGSPGWHSGFEFLIAVDYEVDLTLHGGDAVTITVDYPNATAKAGAIAFPPDDNPLFPYAPAYRDSSAVQIDLTLLRPAGPAA